MDFGSFYSGVSQAWGQLGPSLTYLVTASLAVRYCFPKSCERMSNWLRAGIRNAQDGNQVRDFLIRVGAKPAYPVLVGVVVLLALDVVYGCVAACAEWVPPNVICEDYRIAYQEFAPSDLGLLVRLFPDSESFEDAYGRAQLLLTEKEVPLGGLALCTTIVMLVARALVVTVIFAFFCCLRRESNRKRSVRRTVGVVALAMSIWVVCIVPWLSQYEDGARATADRLIVKIRDHAEHTSSLPASEVPPSFRVSFNGARWWRLDCTARYRAQALWLICFPPKENKPLVSVP
jgi:hypothetical protein